MLPKDVNEAIASSRSAVVTSFLTSEEFTEVMPEGITIPPPATFGGSISLVVSMATVVGTALFALLVVAV
jgi:hypothetical protein